MQNTFFECNDNTLYPSLDKDLAVNTCIIGGGLAGLMCAYQLIRHNISVCVLEKGRIGDGETARSTAMVSFAHDLIYDRLIKKHGEHTAKKYLELQKYGLNEINRIIEQEAIDCDREIKNLILFSQTKKGAKDIDKEYKAYLALDEKIEKLEYSNLVLNETTALNIANAIKIDDQLAINPLKFLKGLAKSIVKSGGQIFENTPAYTKPEGKTLKIGSNKITAKHFIVATHFPFINFPSAYFLKLYQHRSHNIAINAGFCLNEMYESVEENGFEYRPFSDKIIIGGGNVRTGKYKHQSRYHEVINHAKEQFNINDKDGILSSFSAQDCMTPDLMPFCGRFGCLTDGLYVITGFNKWGFTNSAACAKIITDGILDRLDSKHNIFDPLRHPALKAPLKTAAHLGVTISSFLNRLIKTDAKRFKRIQNNMGAVVKIKGKRVGVYRDENGQVHAIAAVCPHLGCSLKWNKDELSWDCPCHGSRFDIDGNILNNPAIEKATSLNRVFKDKEVSL